MLDSVDALLKAAREMLGSGATPAGPPNLALGGQATPPSTWQSDAREQARTVNTQLDTSRENLRTAHTTVSGLVTDVATISRDAHTRLSSTEAAWAQDKAVLAPLSTSAEGRAALIHAAIMRVGETNDIISDAATRFSEAAKQVPTVDTNLFEAVSNQIPPPQGGYVVIWCIPSGPGFLCDYLWPSGKLSTMWSQWDLTGGQPI